MADIVNVKPAAEAKPAGRWRRASRRAHRQRPVLGPQILEAYKQMLISLFLATLAICLVTIAITAVALSCGSSDELVAVVSPLTPNVEAVQPRPRPTRR